MGLNPSLAGNTSPINFQTKHNQPGHGLNPSLAGNTSPMIGDVVELTTSTTS